ncbi:41120_t:CDS:2, partial [Gigaspora margarita]
KTEEHEASIESNEMLEEGLTPLEIFRANKDKIPYCRDYGSMCQKFQKSKQQMMPKYIFLTANRPPKNVYIQSNRREHDS